MLSSCYLLCYVYESPLSLAQESFVSGPGVRRKGKISEPSEFMTMVLLPFSRATDTASTSHPSQTPASNAKVPLVSSRAEIIHPDSPHSPPRP